MRRWNADVLRPPIEGTRAIGGRLELVGNYAALIEEGRRPVLAEQGQASSATSINRLLTLIEQASGVRAQIEHQAPRPGDVRDSLADITNAALAFGYTPTVVLEDGLAEYVAWARDELQNGLHPRATSSGARDR